MYQGFSGFCTRFVQIDEAAACSFPHAADSMDPFRQHTRHTSAQCVPSTLHTTKIPAGSKDPAGISLPVRPRRGLTDIHDLHDLLRIV
jgi:hypothetical protein